MRRIAILSSLRDLTKSSRGNLKGLFKVARFYEIIGIFQGFCGISSQILRFMKIFTVFMDCFGLRPRNDGKGADYFKSPHSLAKTVRGIVIARIALQFVVCIA